MKINAMKSGSFALVNHKPGTASPSSYGGIVHNIGGLFVPRWSLAPPLVASPPILGAQELDSTYLQLIGVHEHNLSLNGPVSDQVVRNHKGTVKAYLAFCSKTLESRVGREFTVEFVEKSRAFANLVSHGNRKAAADKLSILRSWKRTVDKHVRSGMLKSMSGQSEFHKELRLAIASSGKNLKELAKAIKSDFKTLNGWLEGVTPIFSAMPTLRRLEAHLGLERGFLESRIAFPTKNGAKALVGTDKYAERVRVNLKDPYYVTPAMFTQELKDEWFTFMKYKTCQHPIGLKRGQRARWRVLPREKGGIHILKEPLCQPSQDMVCASAYRNLLMLEAFLGFLTKSKSGTAATSGLGLPLDQVQTLAVFAIPEFVDAFFEFIKARSGNLVHNGHANPAGAIATMCRCDEGYLWQQPDLLTKVAEFAKGRTWHELCAQTFELCKSWQRAAVGNRSRDPKIPLQGLLALSDMLAPFKDAIKKLDLAAAAASPGSVHQAVYKRDALLLALSLFNPLRLRTLTNTKYIPPGLLSEFETNLYQTQDGDWWLRFEKGDIKNDGSRTEGYDSPITKDLNRRIENYLELYRPVLVRNKPESPWFFPTQGGGRHNDLGSVIERIAKNYIPMVPRLRPHALRHIVATDFLRRNPGNYMSVAELLHDKLETVLRTYAHGKTVSAFRAHEENMKGFFAGI